MAFIDTVDEQAATGELEEVYDKLLRSRGKVANIMKVHSLNPRAMQAHMDLYLAVMFGRSGLKRAERELIAVVVSATNGCVYYVQHHAEALNSYWKDSERVQRLTRDFRHAGLSGRETALLTGIEPSFVLAFVAGALSFLSPCVLPLLPSFLAYLTGLNAEQLMSVGGPDTGVEDKTSY